MNAYFLLLFILYSVAISSYEKVVIWGHKLHSHTHSYIHERFYRAFQYLGYDTYWFDDRDNVDDFDFSNTLFLTEGQVDHRIPIRDDCYYILHNCSSQKYSYLFAKGQSIALQVYVDRIASAPRLTKVDNCIYYDIPGKCVYMPWASDLLPHEIEEMKKNMPINKLKQVHWLGTIGGGVFGNIDQLKPFKKACQENGISFIHNDPWAHGLNRNEFIARASTSYLSPAIVGKWQEEQGYIPCRIFISIGCGHMGVTNSRAAYELFDKKIIYNPDTYQLFYDAQERLKTWTIEEQHELMDIVRDKHTYVNRIQVLLDFLKLIPPDKGSPG